MSEFNFYADPNEWKASKEEKDFIETDGFVSLFENLLVGLINKKYPEGVPNEHIKTVHRILKKLDETETSSLELEASELDFFEEIFITSKLAIPPKIIRLFMIYKNEVQRCVSQNNT